MAEDTFLTEKQEQQIIDAIADAEKRTSGEIRVHMEHHCETDPLERADQLFHQLGMDETTLQNGVLLYIATEDHKVAVYGGKGIDRKVEEGFWDDVIRILVNHFKADEYEEGIEAAVRKIGRKLEEVFPYRSGDQNELTDEISYHTNTEQSDD
ncbi:MAG: TPM domain-containing protein [Balneolaceae bacterium]|nr:TPM domain-containing protein [Balneolaceae bacterium]